MNVRAPEPSDADAVLDLIVARDIADLGRPDYTLEDVRADWAAPGVDPSLDAWLVESGDGPLGYALLDDRGAALVTVPPAHEGRGVGTALREAAEARAIARGEALVRQYVPITNEGARTHLLEAGYWPAFSYFRMRVDLAGATEPPPDVPVRAFDRGTDDGPVHALVEDAMAGVPGNEPRSLESWQAAKIDREGWDPSLWLLHEDVDGLAGLVLCERWEEGIGYVDYLAVASRARGRGLGRAMLLHGLAALRAAGLAVAELSVQGENASATRLYESVGMQPGLDDRALGEAAPPDVEDDRDGGGEVEARDPGAHRDPHPRRGTRRQLRADAVALGPEREQRAVRQRRELVAGGVEHDQRAVAQRRRVGAADREREVQPRGAAQRRWIPGVARTRREHARGARGRGDAHDGADVAGMARVLEQHHRRSGRGGEQRAGVQRRAPRDRHDAGVWHTRDEPVERPLGDERRQRVAHVRRQPLRQPAAAQPCRRSRPPARRRRSAARA